MARVNNHLSLSEINNLLNIKNKGEIFSILNFALIIQYLHITHSQINAQSLDVLQLILARLNPNVVG